MEKLRKIKIIRNHEYYFEKIGLFHGFFQYKDEQGAECNAIIEFDDGTVDNFPIDWIQFQDKI